MMSHAIAALSMIGTRMSKASPHEKLSIPTEIIRAANTFIGISSDNMTDTDLKMDFFKRALGAGVVFGGAYGGYQLIKEQAMQKRLVLEYPGLSEVQNSRILIDDHVSSWMERLHRFYPILPHVCTMMYHSVTTVLLFGDYVMSVSDPKDRQPMWNYMLLVFMSRISRYCDIAARMVYAHFRYQSNLFDEEEEDAEHGKDSRPAPIVEFEAILYALDTLCMSHCKNAKYINQYELSTLSKNRKREG